MTNKTDISLSPDCVLSIEQALYCVGKESRPHIQKAIIDKLSSLSGQLEASVARIAEQEVQIKVLMDEKGLRPNQYCLLPIKRRNMLEGMLAERIRTEHRDAELAAIRGAAVPVGEVKLSDFDDDGLRSASVVCLHDQADWENFPNGTKLFTHPSPPVVVLPKSREDYSSKLGNGDIGPYNHGHLEGWNDAIISAGGTIEE